jgi:hypothetical protein
MPDEVWPSVGQGAAQVGRNMEKVEAEVVLVIAA